ncbi:Galactose-1-phosphate uridylyltransferase [Pelotomaculum schinkii]|uniref:Galactose-1-phosphate uridylyltransferase n=1 Tax=Pelotomaculum schinkii TaxID=78350 RepID=A0A4Y7RDH6_9FIRM|nr:galactose-1-phosphate uridylyltransferase [Pelotomaculum schinkii]TEB06829.1 Galactose-1-phosphate uridylyltransferase [Pelotomaculum schinkii]
MSEWRKDPIVDRWVVIATERSKRPSNYKEIRDEKSSNECPLCEGHEKETPPEIIAYREQGTGRDTPGWWMRVVPNKFPAVDIEGQPYLQERGVYQFMRGVGAHEVIVESTKHEPGLDTQSVKQVEEVVWGWRDRSLDLRKDQRLKYIQIFKNTGPTAGASLEHTHSQLIATPQIPSEVNAEITGMNEYHNRHGRCALCDIIAQELREGERLVAENRHFVCFAPFASRFPFETWIVPTEHQSDFGQIRAQQVQDLAAMLRSVVRKMTLMIKNIPYNIVLHTSPVNVQDDHGNYHWHLEILPRLTTIAGFELGTGYYINPTPPEIAAQALREIQEFYPLQKESELEVARYV